MTYTSPNAAIALTSEEAERFIADTVLPREGDTLILARDVQVGDVIATDETIAFDSASFFEFAETVRVLAVVQEGENIVILGSAENGYSTTITIDPLFVVLREG